MKTVKGYIERKSMLYKTGDEYGDYTMNHVLGCSHGFKYPCYAFLMAKRFGKSASYDEWIEQHLVSNTLEILDREIPRLKSKIQSVQLCFTTDPFMYEYDEIKEMSLASIGKLNAAGKDVNDILLAISFTDKIIFGRTNYNKDIAAYTKHKDFYNEQAEAVIAFCNERNIAYPIKDGTITD